MKKTILLLICFLSAFVAHGQEPAPPTQEWCKWAFQQLPDHRDISEVDAKAFSVDFYTLLKIAFAINEWEIEKDPGYIGSGEFLAYWYAGNGDSPLVFEGIPSVIKLGLCRMGRPMWTLPYASPRDRHMSLLTFDSRCIWSMKTSRGESMIGSTGMMG